MGEQFRNGFHGIEEAIGMRGKGQKIVAQIELAGWFVFGVHNDGGGGDFAGIFEGAAEGIE